MAEQTENPVTGQATTFDWQVIGTHHSERLAQKNVTKSEHHYLYQKRFKIWERCSCLYNTNVNRQLTAVMDRVWRAGPEPAELSLALKVGQPNSPKSFISTKLQSFLLKTGLGHSQSLPFFLLAGKSLVLVCVLPTIQ